MSRFITNELATEEEDVKMFSILLMQLLCDLDFHTIRCVTLILLNLLDESKNYGIQILSICDDHIIVAPSNNPRRRFCAHAALVRRSARSPSARRGAPRTYRLWTIVSALQ